MVDPENLALVEQRADAVVDLLGGGEVLADRLFHRDPRRRGNQPRIGQPLGRGREERRGCRQIDRQPTLRPTIQPLCQLLELLRLPRFDRLITDHRLQPCRDFRIIAIGADELLQCLVDVGAECFVVHLRAARRHDHEVIGQQTVRNQIIERRKNHAVRQIAGGTEKQERGRRIGQRMPFSVGRNFSGLHETVL